MSRVVGNIQTTNGVTHFTMYESNSSLPKNTKGQVIFPLQATSMFEDLGFQGLSTYSPDLTDGRLSTEEMFKFFLELQPVLDSSKSTLKSFAYCHFYLALIAGVLIVIGTAGQQQAVGIGGFILLVCLLVSSLFLPQCLQCDLSGDIERVIQNSASYYLEKGLVWQFIYDCCGGRYLKLTCTKGPLGGSYHPPNSGNHQVIIDVSQNTLP